jgi:hypothetical protein
MKKLLPIKRCMHVITECFLLTENQHLTPITQQAEKAGLTHVAESEACQSIFPETDKG